MKTAEERREGYLMLTDTKRREVARRLRELPTDMYDVEELWEMKGLDTCCKDQTDYYLIHFALFGCFPADHMHPCDYEELHTRLADLIEPSEAEEWVTSQGLTKEQLIFDWWLSERVMHELGFDSDTADRDEVESRLLARLMPEGMEWPRFEDNEPVHIEDEVVDEAEEFICRVSEIAFSDGYGTCLRYEDRMDGNSYNFIDGLEPGKRVKRPAHKVLDADGVEIRVGDKPYRVDNGKQVEVRRIDPDYGEECVFVGIDGTALGYWLRPDYLTHERPDSWGRLEDDATMPAATYCERMGIEVEEGYSFVEPMARDLVRRCRALAERERGE